MDASCTDPRDDSGRSIDSPSGTAEVYGDASSDIFACASRDRSQDDEWSAAVSKTEDGELEKVEEDLCRAAGG